MPMSQHDVKPGQSVTIRDARSGRRVTGRVQRVLPRLPDDPPGTKVELQNGEIGQVQIAEQG